MQQAETADSIRNGPSLGGKFNSFSVDRKAIESQIEALLWLLDEMDGDPDVEEEEDVCAAHDDGCGAVWINGQLYWGSEEDEPQGTIPIYGVDQRAKPIERIAA